MAATKPATGPELTDSTTAPAEQTGGADAVAPPTHPMPVSAEPREEAITSLDAPVSGVSVPEIPAPEVPASETSVSGAPVVDFPIAGAALLDAPAPALAAEDDAWQDHVYDDDDGEPASASLPAEPARPMFADLGLSAAVLRAIDDMGYRHPTPIQEQAIPFVLMGRDVMGTAQTGTGKTAGFTLPMLDILDGRRARARMPRSLILEPTRELALQVAENFVMYGKYMKLTHALIIGGESMSDQKDVLMKGVDVLIATPGRLIDMFERGSILLTDARLLVIDEADRMLDMGFIPDVERIVAMLPPNRQTLFFSATMGPEIRRLADAFLNNPKEIAVSRPASVAAGITEGLALVAEHDKREALRRLIRTQNVQNALIFCNRKKDVDILHKSLNSHKFSVGALHGDMAQSVRFATLEKFKAGDVRLLVCSDVAARGLDIGGLSHVFNFDVPIHAEDYVHRIGRTGRAGLEGNAFTIAMPGDRFHVEAIEKLIGHPIPPFNVEGLDPVDWAEGSGRRRGSGRSAAGKGAAKTEPRKAASRDGAAKERAPRDAAPKDRAPRTRGPKERDDARREAPPPADRPPAERGQPDRMQAEQAPRERASGDRPPRDRTPRDRTPREHAPRAAAEAVEAIAPRPDSRTRDEPRRDEFRPRDEPRRDEFRPRDEPRRDEFRRERYRRDDDLGPAVRGFGDDVPAFMLLRTRGPAVAEDRETEV